MVYKTQGTCSREIHFDVENNKLKNVSFVGGCNGNLKGIGLLVEGMDNCLIKFSRCCPPVPGDPIVGFITRGQGVSIHRADCPNYLNSLCKHEQEGRWLNVSWADKTMGLYTTTLRILARDRNGLILDIAAVLNALNAKVRSLNARSLPEGNALVYVTTEVPDLASLRLIMARIRTLGGVREIDRGNG